MLFTLTISILTQFGTIQVLENVFYTKVSRIRWLTGTITTCTCHISSKGLEKNEVIGPHHSSHEFILKDVSLVYSALFYGFFSNVSLFTFYHSFPHLKFLLEPTIYNQEALLEVAITELKQKSSINKCKEVVKNNFSTNKQAKQTLILWKNNYQRRHLTLRNVIKQVGCNEFNEHNWCTFSFLNFFCCRFFFFFKMLLIKVYILEWNFEVAATKNEIKLKFPTKQAHI